MLINYLLTASDFDADNSLWIVPDDGKSQLPLAGSTEYDTTGSGVQDPASGGPRGPGSHDQIPPNKPPWFDQPHPVAPWGQQQVRNSSKNRCGGLELLSWLWRLGMTTLVVEVQWKARKLEAVKVRNPDFRICQALSFWVQLKAKC